MTAKTVFTIAKQLYGSFCILISGNKYFVFGYILIHISYAAHISCVVNRSVPAVIIMARSIFTFLNFICIGIGQMVNIYYHRRSISSQLAYLHSLTTAMHDCKDFFHNSKTTSFFSGPLFRPTEFRRKF